MMTMKHGDQVSNDKELSWRQTDATSSNPALMVGGFIFVLESKACWFYGDLSAL